MASVIDDMTNAMALVDAISSGKTEELYSSIAEVVDAKASDVRTSSIERLEAIGKKSKKWIAKPKAVVRQEQQEQSRKLAKAKAKAKLDRYRARTAALQSATQPKHSK